MKIKYHLLVFFFLLVNPRIVLAQSSIPEIVDPTLSINVNVIDGKGEPVESAVLKGGFRLTGEGARPSHYSESDSKGKGLVTGDLELGRSPSIMVTKNGWYRSIVELRGATMEDYERGTLTREATVILREKIAPTSFIARRVEQKIPKLGEKVGYDLEVGDWVAPHGEGKRPMIYWEMVISGSVENYDRRIAMELSFPSAFDGVFQVIEKEHWASSDYQWPCRAVSDNWQKSFMFNTSKEKLSYTQSWKDVDRYVLRVNTVERDGEVVSANYAKIGPNFTVFDEGQRGPGFGILYYYNPKINELSLEFDTDKNLVNEGWIKEP